MFKELKNDLPASIVVFFVAVPLCLGIALASGAPLFAGIIAGIVGGIIVGIASGSPLGVSGPAAGLAVIVLTSIAALGVLDGLFTGSGSGRSFTTYNWALPKPALLPTSFRLL